MTLSTPFRPTPLILAVLMFSASPSFAQHQPGSQARPTTQHPLTSQSHPEARQMRDHAPNRKNPSSFKPWSSAMTTAGKSLEWIMEHALRVGSFEELYPATARQLRASGSASSTRTPASKANRDGEIPVLDESTILSIAKISPKMDEDYKFHETTYELVEFKRTATGLPLSTTINRYEFWDDGSRDLVEYKTVNTYDDRDRITESSYVFSYQEQLYEIYRAEYAYDGSGRLTTYTVIFAGDDPSDSEIILLDYQYSEDGISTFYTSMDRNGVADSDSVWITFVEGDTLEATTRRSIVGSGGRFTDHVRERFPAMRTLHEWVVFKQLHYGLLQPWELFRYEESTGEYIPEKRVVSQRTDSSIIFTYEFASTDEGSGIRWDVRTLEEILLDGEGRPTEYGYYEPSFKVEGEYDRYAHHLFNPDPIEMIMGRRYPSVRIGNQVWMTRNLNTARYSDGSKIPEVYDDTEWSQLASGAWVHYDHDSNKGDFFGKLYNGFAVLDSRGICPAGWRLPTIEDWTELADALGGAAVAGGRMKTIGTPWAEPNVGADNESGFSALPGGYRQYNGEFLEEGATAAFWSSSAQTAYNNADEPGTTSLVAIQAASAELYSIEYFNSAAFYVRCFREIEAAATSTEDAEDRASAVPDRFSLEQNHPNPFNPTTQIRFSLPDAADVRLEVFNLLGQSVAVLVNGRMGVGSHTVAFDGRGLSSGVYLYRITTPSFTQTRVMTLVK